MIILENENGQRLDLNSFKQFGIEWGHNDSIANFETPLEKIPGGSFLALKPKPTVVSDTITMITASMNLEYIRGIASKIALFCSNEFGLPKTLKIFKAYEEGYRLGRVGSVNTTYTSTFNKIDLTINYNDNYLYKAPKTVSKTNITLGSSILSSNSFSKESPLGAHVKIELSGLEANELVIGSQTSDGKKYTIEIGSINGALSFNSRNFELNMNGATQIQRIPNSFRFYKKLYFTGSGTIGYANVTYTEVEL